MAAESATNQAAVAGEDSGGFISQLGEPHGFSLSPGDKVRVTVSGTGGEDFTGDYTVNLNTALEIPFLPPLSVAGLSTQQAEAKLSKFLLDERILREGLFRVSVVLLEYSAIKVTVTGAVFEPGQIVINDNPTGGSQAKDLIPGDNPMERFLSSAILAAGGVTPRADVSRIKVLRRGKGEFVIDFSGFITGHSVEDIPLVAGDLIVVPDSGQFQTELIRPTPITPNEVSTYVSNVTQPRSGRSTLETSDRVVNVTQFYYGTRLAQAAIAAQCAGGIRSTNAGRRVLYVHTDTSTGETNSIERPINALLTKNSDSEKKRGRSDDTPADDELARLEFNPYLMPNDGIVCYDSTVLNISDFFLAVGQVLLPIQLWQNIVDR